MAGFVWSDENWACKATYNILESNSMLDQFEEFLLRFPVAGEFKLHDLPYAQGGISASDFAGRADQMSRKFFFYLLKHYTNRAERPSDTYQEVHRAFTKQFKSTDGTFRTLAEQVDGFFK